MRKESLVQGLIDSLTETEYKEAKSWLSTHLVVWRSKLVILYSALRSKMLAKEKIWHSLYDDQPFDHSRWKSLNSRLLGELETWLSYKQFLRSKQKSNAINITDGYLFLELDYLRQKRLLKKRIRKLEHQLNLNKYWVLDLSLVDIVQDVADRNDYVSEGSHFLDLSIIGLKLRQASLSLSSQTLREHESNIPLLDACLEIAKSEPYRKSSVVAPYRLTVLLYLDLDRGEDHFKELRDDWLSKLDMFPKGEQEGLMRHALNFCIRKINIGSEEYLSQAFSLYKMALSQGILYQRTKISPFTFDNILGIALRLGKTEWAEKFLVQEAKNLSTGENSPTVALNKARLALAKSDFEGVLIALRQSAFDDFIHRMAAETLRLKAYWALDYHDLLVAHIANTRSMLRRKKQLSYHVQNYCNIFDLAEHVRKGSLLTNNDKALLKEKIRLTKPLTERAWLISILK